MTELYRIEMGCPKTYQNGFHINRFDDKLIYWVKDLIYLNKCYKCCRNFNLQFYDSLFWYTVLFLKRLYKWYALSETSLKYMFQTRIARFVAIYSTIGVIGSDRDLCGRHWTVFRERENIQICSHARPL